MASRGMHNRRKYLYEEGASLDNEYKCHVQVRVFKIMCHIY